MPFAAPKIKTLALRVERDRARVERAALPKLTAVAGKAYRHAGHAVRVGADPVKAARAVMLGNARLSLPGMIPTLTRAMVMADLYGRRRTHLDASRGGLSLSAAEDEAERLRKRDRDLAALLLLLGIGGSELASLYASYRPQAKAAAERMADTAEQAILATVSAPSRYTSRHPRGVSVPTGRNVSTIVDSPITRIRQIAEGFQSGGLTIENSYGIEREIAKAVVTKYEQGRRIGTPAATETLWGYHYTAILDSSTTRICRALDGTVAPKDDSFWDRFQPPNHWNCRSTVLPVFRSSALREPSILQPYATANELAEFADIKRDFLSYQ